jgi:glycerate kinase
MVVEYTKLEENIKEADMVWTGEGSIDSQTIFGKTPLGVAKIAEKYDVPVIVLAGRVGDKIAELYDNGIDAIFSIMQEASSLEEALVKGKENIEKLSENLIRFMNVKNKDLSC